MGMSCINIKTGDDNNDVAGLEMHIHLKSQVCFFYFLFIIIYSKIVVIRNMPLYVSNNCYFNSSSLHYLRIILVSGKVLRMAGKMPQKSEF